jgi:hypothetical protein
MYQAIKAALEAEKKGMQEPVGRGFSRAEQKAD